RSSPLPLPYGDVHRDLRRSGQRKGIKAVELEFHAGLTVQGSYLEATQFLRLDCGRGEPHLARESAQSATKASHTALRGVACIVAISSREIPVVFETGGITASHAFPQS